MPPLRRALRSTSTNRLARGEFTEYISADVSRPGDKEWETPILDGCLDEVETPRDDACDADARVVHESEDEDLDDDEGGEKVCEVVARFAVPPMIGWYGTSFGSEAFRIIPKTVS